MDLVKKYKITKLMYYEEYPCIKEAIQREKQLKNWHREWKINLIKSLNPHLDDLLRKLGAEINSA
jgi:putative endonuclease